MAQQTYRGNLTGTNIPFVSDNFGRSVISQELDNAFSRTLGNNSGTEFDYNVPQIIYAENVLPKAFGFTSVGHGLTRAKHASVTGLSNSLGKVFTYKIPDPSGLASANITGYIFSDNDPFTYMYYTELGNGDTTWHQLTKPGAPANAGPLTYVFTLNGITYFHFSGSSTALYSFNVTTHVLTAVVLTGLAIAAGNCSYIFSCGGYMVAIGAANNTLYWSSVVNVFDFTPSLLTGAGSISIQALTSQIVGIAVTQTGFLVFTNDNVISATLTNNSRYPFTFSEVPGGLGAASRKLIDSGVDVIGATVISGDVTNVTGSKTCRAVQNVSLNGVKTVFPQLIDFFNGSTQEKFNSTTGLLEVYRKVSYPYGITPLLVRTMFGRLVYFAYSVYYLGGEVRYYAMVYDSALNRWGKIRFLSSVGGNVPLLDIFEFGNTVAWLDISGNLYVINEFTGTLAGDSGSVLVAGRFQHARRDFITLHEVSIDAGFHPSYAHNITVSYTLDGKTIQGTVEGYVSTDTETVYSELYSVHCNNFTVTIKGAMNLTTLQLTYVAEGD